MSRNNSIYKGFKVSASVRRSSDDALGAGAAQPTFLATATVTQVSMGSGSLRVVPPLLPHHALTPHAAIDLALASARAVIDSLSTSVRHK